MIATRTLSFARAPFFEPFVAGHEFPSFAIALCRDAEPVGERGEDDVVRVGARDATPPHGSRPSAPAERGAGGRGFRLLALCGADRSAIGDAERVGEDADGDVVDVGAARAVSRTSASFNGAGILTRMPARFSEVLAVKLLALYS